MKHADRTVLALAALIAALALAACGEGDDDGTTNGGNATPPPASTTTAKGAGGNKDEGGAGGKPSLPTIIVRGGEPVGGVEELEYSAGEEIRFRVSSDAADEVHVHGYDVEKEVPAGRTVTVSFPAEIEGIFEVELHGSEAQIAELRVNP